jgi:hypothetical protein
MVGLAVRFGKTIEAYTLIVQKKKKKEDLRIGYFMT